MNTDKKREYLRAWRKANRDKVLEHSRRWRRKNPLYMSMWTEANPDYFSKAGKIKYLKNREHYANVYKNLPSKQKLAYRKVYLAIKNSTLIRPDTCVVSGCTRKPNAHHDDYSKPLEVLWLCKNHHMRLHAWGNPNHPPTLSNEEAHA